MPIPSSLQPLQQTIDASKLLQPGGEEIVEHSQDVLVQEDFADYTGVASSKLQSLEQDWEKEVRDTDRRRKLRNISINVRQYRDEKKLARDETIIPIRVIDTNIQREMPPFIAYIKQSRRLAIFKNQSDPLDNTEALEAEFTRVCQYDSWELPQFKVLDGSKTHGWDWVEVVLDVDKPGNFAIEHVTHDELLFPVDARTLQSCEYIVRVYHVTDSQLRNFVDKYGFDAEQTRILLEEKESDARSPRCKKIRKCMWKQQGTGIVYVAWYALDECNDWLKKPAPLYLGIKELQQPEINPMQLMLQGLSGQPVMPPQPQWIDKPETSYPYEALFYYETEESKIFDHKGRVYLDEYKQEATMAVWTGFVNRINRASNVYASPKASIASSDGKPRLVNTELVNGGIYDTALEFWGMPYPDPTTINALQALDTQNAAETNQVAWAVNNRKDSRKTATEIDAAQQQSSLLNGVAVTLYSVFLRRVYTRVWRIVQNRALQGLIKFLDSNLRKQEILAQDYQLFAAGDVDVVQRQEKMARKMQFWPIVAATPAAPMFLSSLLKDAFPDEADGWIQQMMLGQQQQQILAAVTTALIGLSKEFAGQIPPAEQAKIMQIVTAAEQSVSNQTTNQPAQATTQTQQ